MKLSKNRLMELAGLATQGPSVRRIGFKGTTSNDVYRIIQGDENVMIFANGKHYGVDSEEMRHDLQSSVVIGYDEDGGEHDIRVAVIEFIEM